MTLILVFVFVFSVLMDVGAVVFTRSVGERRMLAGILSTLFLGALNWASIWLVVKQDDELMVLAAIIGHPVGYVLGMILPLRGDVDHDVCQRCHPTMGQGSRSSGPS